MDNWFRCRSRWAAVAVAVVAFAALSVPGAASAAPQVDQEQPRIDVAVGGLAVGGFYHQKVAQMITNGVTGTLTEVRLPVACSAGTSLVLQILGVTGDRPNGTVLGTTVIPGTALPAFFPFPGVVTLRSLPLAQGVPVAQGQRVAIAVDSHGDCGMFRGPIGDSYPGGNAYFDSRPNPVGVWVCICDFAGDRWDIPFQTLVERPSDVTPPRVSLSVSPAANSAGWSRSPVTVRIAATDEATGTGVASITCSTTGSDQTTTNGESRSIDITSEGMTHVSCSATDNTGNTSAPSELDVRIDLTAPSITCPGDLSLRPPNHRMEALTFAVDVKDALSGPDGFELSSAASNEADDGLGDGDRAGDLAGWDVGTTDVAGSVRVERAGPGTGRTYTFQYGGHDVAGNQAACAVQVLVPHDAD